MLAWLGRAAHYRDAVQAAMSRAARGARLPVWLLVATAWNGLRPGRTAVRVTLLRFPGWTFTPNVGRAGRLLAPEEAVTAHLYTHIPPFRSVLRSLRGLPCMLRWLLLACLSAVVAPASAQFRVDVSGVGLTQLPIAVAPFRGDESAPQKIAAIVQADLDRSGQFRSLDASGPPLDELSRAIGLPRYFSQCTRSVDRAMQVVQSFHGLWALA